MSQKNQRRAVRTFPEIPLIPGGVDCDLVFFGNEWNEKTHAASAHWTGIKLVHLPFAPRKGMRIGGIIKFDLEMAVWEGDEDEMTCANDEYGYKVSEVVFDCQHNRFRITFYDPTIYIPWESTSEALAKTYRGWKWKRDY